MVRLLKDELTLVMRLMGTPQISDIQSNHVISRNLKDHVPSQGRDHLHLDTYEPLRTVRGRALRGERLSSKM